MSANANYFSFSAVRPPYRSTDCTGGLQSHGLLQLLEKHSCCHAIELEFRQLNRVYKSSTNQRAAVPQDTTTTLEKYKIRYQGQKSRSNLLIFTRRTQTCKIR